MVKHLQSYHKEIAGNLEADYQSSDSRYVDHKEASQSSQECVPASDFLPSFLSSLQSPSRGIVVKKVRYQHLSLESLETLNFHLQGYLLYSIKMFIFQPVQQNPL